MWQVQLKNGDIYPIVWKKAEFNRFIGVKGDIPLPLLDEFFTKIVGRTDVTVIIEPGKKPPAPPC